MMKFIINIAFVYAIVTGVGGVFLSVSEIKTSICLHYDSKFL